MAPTAYLFQKKGKIVFETSESVQLEDMFDQAIEAGCMDVDTDYEGRINVLTEPSDTFSVANKLVETTGLKIESSEILWDPNEETLVKIESEDAARKLDQCVAQIEDDASVQGVYLNTV